MSSYSRVEDHRSMFFDDFRNDFYAKAIEKVVNKDSVVLDLGAGLGLHGFMAIQKGAKKAYLVEPAAIIENTKLLVKSNNLTDEVECIRGKIEEVDLPEKVDCIISVFTGNFLLSEDLLPSLFYARDHHLKPGGKLIPDRAKMEVVPVFAEEYYRSHIDCWHDTTAANINVDPIRRFAVNTLYYDYPINRNEVFLAEPAKLLDLDFMTATEAACRNKVEVNIFEDGLCHGWLGWFQTRVGESWLSTSPKEEQMHWRQVFLPLNKPIQLKKGETVQFELIRPEYGEWTWTTYYREIHQRQSTFHSQMKSSSQLQMMSNSYAATLSAKGNIALDVLNQLDGKRDTSILAAYILETYPLQFKTYLNAEQFVKELIERYV